MYNNKCICFKLGVTMDIVPDKRIDIPSGEIAKPEARGKPAEDVLAKKLLEESSKPTEGQSPISAKKIEDPKVNDLALKSQAYNLIFRTPKDHYQAYKLANRIMDPEMQSTVLSWLIDTTDNGKEAFEYLQTMFDRNLMNRSLTTSDFWSKIDNNKLRFEVLVWARSNQVNEQFELNLYPFLKAGNIKLNDSETKKFLKIASSIEKSDNMSYYGNQITDFLKKQYKNLKPDELIKKVNEMMPDSTMRTEILKNLK